MFERLIARILFRAAAATAKAYDLDGALERMGEVTVRAGTFDCPICRSEKKYAHKRLRCDGKIVEFVECQFCQRKFKPEIMPGGDRDPEELKQDYRRAWSRVMGLVMMADGKPQEKAVEAYRKLHRALTEREVGREFVDQLIEELRAEAATIAGCLESVSPRLGEDEKLHIIESAGLLMAAGGTTSERQTTLNSQISKALGN